MSPAGPSQKTLANEGRIAGIGLHTGLPCAVTVRPAGPDSGIRFFKQGRPVGSQGDAVRCSSLGEGPDRILTIEHLLASLRGLGITNLVVDVEGDEVPGLDGSALPFVRLFRQLGIVEQHKPADFYRIREPIFCYDERKAIAIYPADAFSVSYMLDYEHPYLRGQQVDFTLTPEVFEREIAPARTFCTEREARELRQKGFGRGANAGNTLVVSEDGSHRERLRFEDECARHKVLDILGDLNLLGFPVVGRVAAVRSGHALNRRLVEAIKKQKDVP